MIYILFIFTMFFETPIVPMSVAQGFQNDVHTEGVAFITSSFTTPTSATNIEDDDDSDDSNESNKNAPVLFFCTPSNAYKATLLGKSGVITHYAFIEKHCTLQRRLFILFHDLKIDC